MDGTTDKSRTRATSRRSLRWRGLAVLAVGIAGTWATGILVLDRHVREHDRQHLQREVQLVRLGIARRAQSTRQELLGAAAGLVASPSLRQAVAQRDRPRVAEILAWQTQHGWAFVLITDYLGRVLAAAGTPPAERDVLASPAVGAAIAGEAGDAFWEVGERVFHVRLEPIQEEGEVLGALALGRSLDTGFLGVLRGGTQPHLSLRVADRQVAATAPLEARDTVASVSLGDTADGRPVALDLLPGSPTEDTSIPWKVLTASAGLWLLGSTVLGGMLLRAHGDSLRGLARAAERMADGDLETPVTTVAFEESGVIGDSLEDLRSRLRRRVEDAEGRCRELTGALELERCIGEQAEQRLGKAEATLREQIGSREMLHELKTPVATVNATMAGIRHGLAEWTGSLQALDLASFEPDEARLFFAALEEMEVRAPLGPLPPAVQGTLADELARAGVRDPEGAARVLVRSGLASRAVRLLPLLRRRDGAAVLSALKAFGRLQVHLSSGLKAAEMLCRMGTSLGRLQGRRDELDLRDGLADALALLDHELRGRVEVHDDLPVLPPVRGDAAQLCQVWTNLIHNAVQAMGDGGGRLLLDAREEGGWLRVGVTDSGPGVDPVVRGRIFEPHVSTKSPGEGTGIGLSLVRRIVESHGGRIAVHSIPGRTRFEVSLPVSGRRAAAATA
ncbi:MAG: ATP-binding protein [Acidobacteriota bacterium]|jgi:signal transduction histidine kinase